MKLDRIVVVLAALVAPALAVCVANGWLSAHDAETAGGIVAALVGAYHVPNDTARAALAADPPGIQSL